MIQLREYLFEDGSSPFAKWFDNLDPSAAAKVSKAKIKLSLGHMGNVKPIGEISEYKIDYGPGYRIYLGKDGERLIILLGGGDKGGQQGDIAEAKRLWAEYRRRKAEATRMRKAKVAPKAGEGPVDGSRKGKK